MIGGMGESIFSGSESQGKGGPEKSDAAAGKRRRLPLILGAVVLLVYPFCLMANMMSLGGHESSRYVPPLAWWTWRAFLWGTTIYPAIYLGMAGLSGLFASNSRPNLARHIAWVPLAYLGVMLLLLVALNLF